MSWIKTLTGVLAIGASLLAALAILVNYGYLPATLAGGYSAVELGGFAGLAAVGAIAIYAYDEA
jgi:hypothetical protein